MSTTAIATASNAESAPSFFSLLPNDVVLNIFARVPKRYHPILYCVSKSIKSLLHSSAFHETRSVLGNDSLYLCFRIRTANSFTAQWFNLIRRQDDGKIQLVTPPFTNQTVLYSNAIAIRPYIYQFEIFRSQQPSNSTSILDTRSRDLHEGPNMLVNRLFPINGLIDNDTIYVVGGCNINHPIQAEMFNTETQTWEIAPNPPNPDPKLRYIQNSGQNLTVNGKIYVDLSDDSILVYDPKNGNCSNLQKPKGGNGELCVVDNVIYGYFLNFGLMWYNMRLKIWIPVKGLDRFDNRLRLSIGMTEFGGKLAVFTEKLMSCYGEIKQIWCTLIELVKVGLWINGRIVENEFVSIVPRDYRLQYCVYSSD